jgi:hypothetical protein
VNNDNLGPPARKKMRQKSLGIAMSCFSFGDAVILPNWYRPDDTNLFLIGVSYHIGIARQNGFGLNY